MKMWEGVVMTSYNLMMWGWRNSFNTWISLRTFSATSKLCMYECTKQETIKHISVQTSSHFLSIPIVLSIHVWLISLPLYLASFFCLLYKSQAREWLHTFPVPSSHTFSSLPPSRLSSPFAYKYLNYQLFYQLINLLCQVSPYVLSLISRLLPPHLLILCLSSILTATLCPVSSCIATFTFPKFPWPRVSPRVYLRQHR